MIRINLLSTDRSATKKRKPLQSGQKMTAACSLILVLTGAFVAWRYVSLTRDSTRLDAEIAAAQQETTRLHNVIRQVQEFEQRKAQLQQRVVLIEQLRKSQTGPVHMLDQISRALPNMLWLTEVKQNPKLDDEVLIEGRSTSLTGLSDFVMNLEASGYFKRSIEIVSTTTEAIPQPPGELIRFQIRALFQRPDAAKAKPATGAPKVGG